MSPDADSEEAHVQDNIDVEMNEDAVKGELDRRTIEIEINVDDVHAMAVDQLESAGVPLEDVLAHRLQRSVEGVIYQILQEAKYSE